MIFEHVNYVCPKCSNHKYMYKVNNSGGRFEYKCINCNQYFAEEELMDAVVDVGNSNTYSCSICGETVAPTIVICDECRRAVNFVRKNMSVLLEDDMK